MERTASANAAGTGPIDLRPEISGAASGPAFGASDAVKRDLGRVGDAAPTYHLADDNDDGNHDDTDKAD